VALAINQTTKINADPSLRKTEMTCLHDSRLNLNQLAIVDH
jgi:hypothetical protein